MSTGITRSSQSLLTRGARTASRYSVGLAVPLLSSLSTSDLTLGRCLVDVVLILCVVGDTFCSPQG